MRKPLRTPKSDELWVVPEGFKYLDERVYLLDLAPYLNTQAGRLARKVRSWGRLLHKATRGSLGPPALWVTPHIAMRLIAAIRAEQGEMMRRGQDPIMATMRVRRNLARKRLLAKAGGGGSDSTER